MATTYHILNGDALTDRFVATGLRGEILVAREALISGPLDGNTLDEFYETRASYHSNEDKNFYPSYAVSQFEKMLAAPNDSEFNLWFGYDLFCQVNMWFILSLLNDMPVSKEVYTVYPSHLKSEDVWKDFGGATATVLLDCFNNRIAFDEDDILLGKKLWFAFKDNDLIELERLSNESSDCFPYLKEVCRAHIERYPFGNGRPERVIEEIISTGHSDFSTVFRRFFEREGIYGFGDVQLKEIYDNVMKSKQ
jgi:hypothetical protein